MESKPGTYVLVLQNHADICVQVGRWGQLKTRLGCYAYVGSAFGPGGVLSRVSRHCRADKAKHWHIDYLREHTSPVVVWYYHSTDRLEHRWAQALSKLNNAQQIDGFGCSDCKCPSHLFHFRDQPKLTQFKRTTQLSVKSFKCEQLRH